MAKALSAAREDGPALGKGVHKACAQTRSAPIDSEPRTGNLADHVAPRNFPAPPEKLSVKPKRLMWKSLRARASPQLPEGLRIYAVGDIHGRADLLKQLFSRVDEDLKRHPIAETIHIFLGDYIDRGQNSAAVLDLVIERARTHRTSCLKGNHEVFLSEFLENPAVFKHWARNGGLPTLASYGLTPTIDADPKEQAKLSASLCNAIPKGHSQFLAGLTLSFTCGDFFFVHAGVRPGTPLSSQREDDLLWIREDFLLHDEPFEKIIVHGHTPVLEPDVRNNRINIDTGAYATGRLTCLKLERDSIEFV